MKDKLFVLRLLKKEDKKHKEKSNVTWILTITLLAFIISILFNLLSDVILSNSNIFIAIIIVFIFILIGIVFDVIGVAVTSASEEPFHAMSSKKIKGSNVAVLFKKNADKVSSFCNDVIGDICGIISGSAGVYVGATLAIILNFNPVITSLITTGVIAALTIGGKAIGKSFAINKSTTILYKFSKVISYFYNPKK